MVIEPFVRMGPPPRSLAAEANNCFMVRLSCGANRIQVRGAILCALGRLPSVRLLIAAATFTKAAVVDPKTTAALPDWVS
jgi:hypothetical protein